MKRTPLVRRTPLRQVSLKRVAHKTSRSVSTGPDANTVEAVLERDAYSCAVCGELVGSRRGVDYSIHHRRPRRMGGTSQPDTNLPSNLLTVCGSGTTGCHGHIESHRADAYDAGWLLHASDVPSQTPILHALHGWVFCTDDGRVELVPPPILRGKVIEFGGYWNPDEVA